jgi:hypothetical protein
MMMAMVPFVNFFAPCVFLQLGNAAGLGFPEWFDAGKVSIENGAIGFPAVKASFGEPNMMGAPVPIHSSSDVEAARAAASADDHMAMDSMVL